MKPLSKFATNCFFLFIAGTAFLVGTNTKTYAQKIIINHLTLNIDDIPQTTLDKARFIRMSIDHASVGDGIKRGMDYLEAQNEKRYSYSNWFWRRRPNVNPKWKIDQFVKWVGLNSEKYDVFMMKLCYVDSNANFAYYRDQMQALELKYPNKKFVWWTIPLMIDSDVKINAFNAAVRKYCAANNKPIFDIADIESHLESGDAVRKKGEVLAKEYSDGILGHLNEVGERRVAKGIWSLMSQLVGLRVS